MEWKIPELGERSDEKWIEMVKGTGGKRSSGWWDPRKH